MKCIKFLREKYLIILTVLISINEIKGQEQLKTCWGDRETDDPYFVGSGFTCCNSLLLEHPLKPKSEHWKKCLSQQHGKAEDDIPTTMWNAYMCELSSAGSVKAFDVFKTTKPSQMNTIYCCNLRTCFLKFSENDPSYKDFETFCLKNYPDEVRNRVLSKNVTCDVAKDANTATRLQRYEDCYWKTEEDVCIEMASVTAVVETRVTNDSEPLCEPITKLPNPNHSFVTFAQPCCKGEELPYPLFDVFMDFNRFDLADKVIGCAESLKNKLKELNVEDPIDLGGPLTACEVACVHDADGFGGKYNANFKDLLNFKMKSVSNSTKEVLLKTIARYNPQFQLFGNNQTVPMDKVGEAIANLSETNKILNYCKFHFEATAEAYRALYEYCYNEEYGTQFRDDILKTINRGE